MQNIFTPTTFVGSDTTIIGTGNVFVHSIVIAKATAGTITLENTAGDDYFVFPTATVGNTYIFDAVFPAGLKITTSGADVGVVNWGQ